MLKVLAHPLNKVAFEHAFDKLVKGVQGYQLVDIYTGEILGEWLGGGVVSVHVHRPGGWKGWTHRDTINHSICLPKCLWVKYILTCLGVCSGDRKSGSISSGFSRDDAQLCEWVKTGHLLSTETWSTPCAPLTDNAASKTCSG